MVGLAFTARDFYPRPPRGGRHHPAIISREQKEISIHALREEGDPVRNELYHHHQHFYPRPPRGGRRPDRHPGCHDHCISIHALREEGDYPSLMARIRSEISIHALREEGDEA